MSLEVGKVIGGKVVKITNFGAFVKLESGETGLVHISEIHPSYVKNVNDYVKENDEVKVKVLAIKDGRKIDLSIKQAAMKENVQIPERVGQDQKVAFEKMMKRFLKESEERLLDIKRNRETKQA